MAYTYLLHMPEKISLFQQNILCETPGMIPRVEHMKQMLACISLTGCITYQDISSKLYTTRRSLHDIVSSSKYSDSDDSAVASSHSDSDDEDTHYLFIV